MRLKIVDTLSIVEKLALKYNCLNIPIKVYPTTMLAVLAITPARENLNN